ncbi:hypothetical protein C0992_001645 [Termitomyces sp. T32_za158]|nr:hypothetical protein C0992_001645 [Termitomyces sp. T32_za158]
MSPSPLLPQELVDYIIDYLFDDTAALRNCSLVCHAWRPSSQLHLFSTLSLKATPRACPAELCRRLYHLLRSSPTLCLYIREVDILEGSQPLAGSPSVIWATTDRTLPHILRRLTHLRRLDFGAQSATIHWSRMSPATRRAVRDILALPSLTHLRLAFWVFQSPADLARLLARPSRLRALTLANISFAQPQPAVLSDLDEEHVPAAPRRPARLSFLAIEHLSSAPFGDWLLGPDSALDLTALRELRVALFNDTAYIQRLLARAGPSLKHFHFKMGESHPHPFDLRPNANLTTLKLTLEDATRALSWVPAFLARPAAHNALARVRLEFYTPLHALPAAPAAWAALDALFARAEFAALTRVDVGLFALPTSPEYRAVASALPILVERGVARFYRLGVRSHMRAKP